MFEGQASDGDAQTYTADKSVNIRTGNGAGVSVTIPDVNEGKPFRLGQRGQVVDQVWNTTQ